jgi:cobalt-precorrin-5B (C1)-methyltransferase
MTVKARNKSGHKSLRHGYTTGACAAAAAKAAAFSLLEQAKARRIKIRLPDEHTVDFRINKCVFDESRAECSVIKDAGDDPDSTDGAEIRAAVEWQDGPGITITGGEGVGTVTKPGLEIPVGQPAINPVPRQMIENSVEEIIRERGVKVTISVTDGKKLAEKTLNSRIGITGGISILGTTGIVIPYSVNAYKASISQSLDISVACGCEKAVLTTGRRSEKYAQAMFSLPEECFIQAGDFIGHSLEECARKRIKEIIIWGMTGKISKLGTGFFYTNISDSRVDFNFLLRVAADCGVTGEKLEILKTAVTANHFRRLLSPEHVPAFCKELCRIAAEKCKNHTDGNLNVICILSDYDGTILGRSDEEK